MAFCQWLSTKEGKKYRLPTEAEWEYACRAGTTTRYYNGNDPEGPTRIANVRDAATHRLMPGLSQSLHSSDGWAFTSPVGRLAPNNFGLYDMLGNAAEWCADWFDENYYVNSPTANPGGPPTRTRRVLRGEGWFAKPLDCRPSRRLPRMRMPRLVFRCSASRRFATAGLVGANSARARPHFAGFDRRPLEPCESLAYAAESPDRSRWAGRASPISPGKGFRQPEIRKYQGKKRQRWPFSLQSRRNSLGQLPKGGRAMPDGTRRRRFSANLARRTYYAHSRSFRFARRLGLPAERVKADCWTMLLQPENSRP